MLVTAILVVVPLTPEASLHGAPAKRDRAAAKPDLALANYVAQRATVLFSPSLIVREPESFGFESLTLVSEDLSVLDHLPASAAVYYALCTRGRSCRYPMLARPWPVIAFHPRLVALELAVLTFMYSSTDLVIVALPTSELRWAIFSREDVLRAIRGISTRPVITGLPNWQPFEENVSNETSAALLGVSFLGLTIFNSKVDPPYPEDLQRDGRALIDRLTMPRLFVPVPSAHRGGPVVAIRLFGQ